MNQQIKCIIFDVGYTLIEYQKCSWPEVEDQGLRRAYRYLNDRVNELPPFTEFKNQFAEIKEHRRIEASKTLAGWQAEDVVHELLLKFDIVPDQELKMGILESIHLPTRDIMYIQDDTAESLLSLKNAGYGLGIISNTIFPSSLHMTDLEMMEISSFFDFAIFSSECPHRKPHPSIFNTGIEKAGASAEEIIYVGDRHDTDVLGARAVGIYPVLKICDRQIYPDPLPKNLPVIHRISELINLLNPA